MRTLLLIGIGGGLGSIVRYLSSVLLDRYSHLSFPYATFAANVLGCFLIGLILGLLQKNNLAHSDLKFFLVTGFCGGFTTFSAFSQENINLLQSGQSGTAFLYIAVSLLVCLGATWTGLMITKF